MQASPLTAVFLAAMLQRRSFDLKVHQDSVLPLQWAFFRGGYWMPSPSGVGETRVEVGMRLEEASRRKRAGYTISS